MTWSCPETCYGPSSEEHEAGSGGPAPPAAHSPAGAQATHQRLHDGMVGGVHVGVQREGTLPLAVVGGIAFGRYDPVLRERAEDQAGRGFRTTWNVGAAGSCPLGRNIPPVGRTPKLPEVKGTAHLLLGSWGSYRGNLSWSQQTAE